MKVIKILDVGCGRGAKIVNLQTKGHVTGIDISSEFIDTCQRLYPTTKFFVMDALDMSFKPKSFDEIYCMDVIEHVNDPNLLLKNIYKVLKLNGKLYIDIPYYKSEKLLSTFNSSYPSQVHHQNIFSYADILKLLNNNNFFVQKFHKTKFFDNIYLLFYFLRGKKIQNQQGEFFQKSKLDKLMSYIIQYLYSDNYLDLIIKSKNYAYFNKISRNYFNIPLTYLIKFSKTLDTLFSPFFPKSLSLECRSRKNPNNTLSIFDTKTKNIDLSSYFLNDNRKTIDTLIKNNNKLKKEKENLKSELDIYKNSHFYKFWPLYTKIKKILNYE